MSYCIPQQFHDIGNIFTVFSKQELPCAEVKNLKLQSYREVEQGLNLHLSKLHGARMQLLRLVCLC